MKIIIKVKSKKLPKIMEFGQLMIGIQDTYNRMIKFVMKKNRRNQTWRARREARRCINLGKWLKTIQMLK